MFEPKPVLTVTGKKCKRVLPEDGWEKNPFSFLNLSERPIENKNAGLVEGILRTKAGDGRGEAHILKAMTDMFRTYTSGPFYVVMTSNLIMKSKKEETFSVYFGQVCKKFKKFSPSIIYRSLSGFRQQVCLGLAPPEGEL